MERSNPYGAIVEKDSALAIAYVKHYYGKLDDLPMTLLFDKNFLRDIARKANGNPFDNTNTIYRGFPDIWELNKKLSD